MGCFLACFSTCKHKKQRHKHHGGGANEHQKLGEVIKVQVYEEPIKPLVELNNVTKEKAEEQSSNGKKKVTFDLDVKTYEAKPTGGEVADSVVENNEEKQSEKDEELTNKSEPVSVLASNVASYPPNHRYQNCTKGEEYEDIDLDDSDLDDGGLSKGGGDDDDIQDLIQAESSESLFSLSIDSRKYTSGAELCEKEVTSPMPKCVSTNEEDKRFVSDRDARNGNQCVVGSVLNPVENLIQWKSEKVRATLPLQHQDKENMSSEPKFKPMTRDSKEEVDKRKIVDQDVAVDTSLSSWLATPVSSRSAGSVGNSPSGRASTPRSHEDRPILGALTVEELKQLSAASTPPRRARSRSPDETPIIGTVGRYWIHTGLTVDSDSGSSGRRMPNNTSKDGQNETEKRDTTPFKTRLERTVTEV